MTYNDLKLHELSGRQGARRARKRVGRGAGSGHGKTAGRGMKGQKSRSGTALGGFEGGQMPLYQRLPKRGFNPPRRKRYAVVNLGALQAFVDAGKIDPAVPVDEDVMLSSGLVRRQGSGVRLLAKGALTHPLTVIVTGASKSACAAVSAIGGQVTIGVQTAPSSSGDDASVPGDGTRTEAGDATSTKGDTAPRLDASPEANETTQTAEPAPTDVAGASDARSESGDAEDKTGDSATTSTSDTQ